MIRLSDKMGIFPAVNIINKQRNKNSPSSPRKHSSYYWGGIAHISPLRIATEQD